MKTRNLVLIFSVSAIILLIGAINIQGTSQNYLNGYQIDLMKLFMLKSATADSFTSQGADYNHYIDVYSAFLADDADRIEPLLLDASYLVKNNYVNDDRVPVIVIFNDDPIRFSSPTKDLAIINGAAVKLTMDEIRNLNSSRSVDKVYLDRKVRLPENNFKALSVDYTEDTRNAQLDSQYVWDSGYDGTGVVIAIVDTGINAAHPDLAGKVIGQKSFVEGYTYVDGNGHGTHCASLAAGTGLASEGNYKGVAPGAMIMSAKVLDDSGSGYTSDIISGIQWVVDNGADIISMSLGGSPFQGISDPMTIAVNNAVSRGVLVIAAAGNDGGE